MGGDGETVCDRGGKFTNGGQGGRSNQFKSGEGDNFKMQGKEKMYVCGGRKISPHKSGGGPCPVEAGDTIA